NGDVAGHARALSELARVQEYAGRPEESLRTCREAVELARRAEDTRLQAALYLRLADTLERLGDPAAAQLHRGAAQRMLGEEPQESDAAEPGPEQEAFEPEHDANACEIRSTSAKD
ncbi:tetratricopeptide repeat protein, partial [Streptomyces sp. T21Q-yed]